MSTATIIMLVVTIIVIAAVAWWAWQRQRADNLRRRFGPEYTYAVEQYGSEARAQAPPPQRAPRMETFTPAPSPVKIMTVFWNVGPTSRQILSTILPARLR